MEAPAVGLWNTIKQNKIGLILSLVVFPIIIIFILWAIVSLKSVSNVQQNWVKYRCHPAIIPIAGLFNDGDGNPIDSGKNFDYCKNQGLHQVASFAMEPFQYMFSLLKDVLSGIVNSVDSLRELFTRIREAITSLVGDSTSKVANVSSEVVSLISRMRDIFSRLVGSGALMASFTSTMLSTTESVFQLAYSFVTSMIYAAFAMAIILSFIFPEFLAFTISLGAGLGIAYCFDEDTIIKTSDGYKKIKNINIGDDIIQESNGKLHTTEGVMKFTSDGVIMYKLGDVVVSGFHKVLYKGDQSKGEKNKWIYVKDHPYATKIKNYNKKYIYCLITDTNKIPIRNNLFTDYEEVSEQKHLEDIEKIVWGKIMGEVYSSGLYKNTKIRMNDNTLKPVSEIDVGDILANNSIVESIIKLNSYDIDIYNYDGVFISGYTWVMLKNKFYWVKDIITTKWIPEKDPIVYQLITSSGEFIVVKNDGTELIIRDYIDTHDTNKLEEIEKYVMTVLNK